jgi:hypothetical protein
VEQLEHLRVVSFQFGANEGVKVVLAEEGLGDFGEVSVVILDGVRLFAAAVNAQDLRRSKPASASAVVTSGIVPLINIVVLTGC